MEQESLTIVFRLFFALVAGGLIGLERSYHGRPAGFRTHSLVCIASSLLMLFTVKQWQLMPDTPMEIMRVDPTRMAQGIMTGIGFLGAGVIMKEKLAIRGLTTAASIWMTAAIGIIIGVGYYFPATVAFLFTIGALSLFRWIERIIPSFHFGWLSIRFLRKEPVSDEKLHALLGNCNTTATKVSYVLNKSGDFFQYQMTIRTKNVSNFQKLAELLNKTDSVYEFKIIQAGE